MLGQYFDVKFSEPTSRAIEVRMLGTGAAAPTKEFGMGITITRTGVGAYRLTFAENPGNDVNAIPGLTGTTPSSMAGFTLVTNRYDSANKRLDIALFDAANAAVDLTSAQNIHLLLIFKESKVGPV